MLNNYRLQISHASSPSKLFRRSGWNRLKWLAQCEGSRLWFHTEASNDYLNALWWLLSFASVDSSSTSSSPVLLFFCSTCLLNELPTRGERRRRMRRIWHVNRLRSRRKDASRTTTRRLRSNKRTPYGWHLIIRCRRRRHSVVVCRWRIRGVKL